jgi:hypothetical protein
MAGFMFFLSKINGKTTCSYALTNIHHNLKIIKLIIKSKFFLIMEFIFDIVFLIYYER